MPVAEGFERARSYARQAIALDDRVAEAHASLAWTMFIYDWDWPGAIREFRRAIELDPLYATSHQWYAFLLLSQGRIEEGLLEAHTALELDPASVSVRRSVAHSYLYARRYDQAIHHIERAIALDPVAVENYRLLGSFLVQQEHYEEAIRVLRDALQLPDAGTGPLATLAYALARSGAAEEARVILRQFEDRARRVYVSPVVFVTINLGLGEFDRALESMERAYTERRGWMAYLNVNPILDPVRNDARFRTLVQRMKLTGPRNPDRERFTAAQRAAVAGAQILRWLGVSVLLGMALASFFRALT